MRQIKFRGKRVDNGKWVYGDYFKTPLTDENSGLPPDSGWFFLTGKTNHCIGQDGVAFVVDPATIGQFTGLLDKNGKEIWEGDVLRDEPKDDWDKINFTCYEVFFHDGNANMDYNIGYSIARTHHHGSVCGGYIPSFKPKSVSKMIVCGNIHDSPSLTNH